MLAFIASARTLSLIAHSIPMMRTQLQNDWNARFIHLRFASDKRQCLCCSSHTPASTKANVCLENGMRNNKKRKLCRDLQRRSHEYADTRHLMNKMRANFNFLWLIRPFYSFAPRKCHFIRADHFRGIQFNLLRQTRRRRRREKFYFCSWHSFLSHSHSRRVRGTVGSICMYKVCSELQKRWVEGWNASNDQRRWHANTHKNHVLNRNFTTSDKSSSGQNANYDAEQRSYNSLYSLCSHCKLADLYILCASIYHVKNSFRTSLRAGRRMEARICYACFNLICAL